MSDKIILTEIIDVPIGDNMVLEVKVPVPTNRQEWEDLNSWFMENHSVELESVMDTYFTETPFGVDPDDLKILLTHHFMDQWHAFGLSNRLCKDYKKRLRDNPNEGWAIPKGSEGISVSDAWTSEISIKQGNVIRVVYTYVKSVNTIFCLMVYSHISLNGIKGQKDLTAADKKKLNDMIQDIKFKYKEGEK